MWHQWCNLSVINLQEYFLCAKKTKIITLFNNLNCSTPFDFIRRVFTRVLQRMHESVSKTDKEEKNLMFSLYSKSFLYPRILFILQPKLYLLPKNVLNKKNRDLNQWIICMNLLIYLIYSIYSNKFTIFNQFPMIYRGNFLGWTDSIDSNILSNTP